MLATVPTNAETRELLRQFELSESVTPRRAVLSSFASRTRQPAFRLRTHFCFQKVYLQSNAERILHNAPQCLRSTIMCDWRLKAPINDLPLSFSQSLTVRNAVRGRHLYESRIQTSLRR